MTDTYKITLERQNCCVCGIVFAIPQTLANELRANGQTFWCPNRHSLSWAEHAGSEKARLERQLVAERAAHDQTRASRDMKKRQLAAAKGQITKVKNRVGNGVCPCCNRAFENLRRHMSTKHPRYKEASDG